jgi:hypothetical protein
MEEAGRVKLAQDLVQLEIASAPLGAPASWGFIYDVRLSVSHSRILLECLNYIFKSQSILQVKRRVFF